MMSKGKNHKEICICNFCLDKGDFKKGHTSWQKGLKGIEYTKHFPNGVKGGVRKGYKQSDEHKRKRGLAHRNKIVKTKTRQKLSLANKKAWRIPEIRDKYIRSFKIYHNLPHIKKKTSEFFKQLWYNNPELHPNRKMPNVSKPQKKLYKIISRIFGENFVFLEYPVRTNKSTRFIDVAIPMFNLGFEYDGNYWHQDKEKDLKRDKELEEVNWNIIHLSEEKEYGD